MKFDMEACWARGVELARNNFQLLLVVAAVFVFLPTAAFYFATPDMGGFGDPNADPEKLGQQMFEQFSESWPIVAPGFLLFLLLQFVGQAAMVALIGGERPTVGEAIQRGLRAFPSMLGAFVLTFLLGLLVVVAAFVPFILIGAVFDNGIVASIAAFLGFVAAMVAFFYVMARISLSTPAIVLAGETNPVKALQHSANLTRGNVGPIFLFWAVVYLIIILLGVMFGLVIGLVASFAGGGTITALIIALGEAFSGAISAVVISVLLVAMFGQLSGAVGTDSLAQTFE